MSHALCTPLMQLPQEVRELAECPFPVEWQPVVSLLQIQAPEIDGNSLRDTLKRKEACRTLQFQDLVQRVEAGADQGLLDAKAAWDAFLTGGGEPTAFV